MPSSKSLEIAFNHDKWWSKGLEGSYIEDARISWGSSYGNKIHPTIRNNDLYLDLGKRVQACGLPAKPTAHMVYKPYSFEHVQKAGFLACPT